RPPFRKRSREEAFPRLGARRRSLQPKQRAVAGAARNGNVEPAILHQGARRPSMIPVVHVAADLGQGGTERSIELLATAGAGPAGQRVVALDRDGPTGERLRAAGVPVEVFAGDYEAAARAIAGRGAAVALLNRSGRPEAKWTGVIRRLAAGPVLPL